MRTVVVIVALFLAVLLWNTFIKGTDANRTTFIPVLGSQ